MFGPPAIAGREQPCSGPSRRTKQWTSAVLLLAIYWGKPKPSWPWVGEEIRETLLANLSPFFVNSALLLAIAVVYDLLILSRKKTQSRVQVALLGFGLGLVCIAVMSAPLELQRGLIFDTRSVLLCVSGLFFGNVATVVAMAVAGTFRLLQGGIGGIVGVGVILTSGILGLLARRIHKKSLAEVSVQQLLVLGITVHVAMLLWMLLLPTPVVAEAIATITLPVLTIYPATTIAMGMLMRNRTRWHEAVARLEESENYARLLFSESPLPQIILHLDTLRVEDCNQAAVKSFRLRSREDLVGEYLPAWMGSGSDQILSSLVKEPMGVTHAADSACNSNAEACTLLMRTKDGREWNAEPWIGRFVHEGRQYSHLSLVDTTEASKARKQLQESEERLRLALASARQGLYDLNVQTGSAKVNDDYAIMLGYDPAEFSETNAAWLERIHPDDYPAVSKAFRDYVAGKMPEYKVEFRQRTKQGNWVWILSLGRIVEYDADGRPLRMLGTHTDLSDLKREAEEKLEALRALWESEDRFQRAITEAPIPIMLHAEDGEIVFVSDTWCEITGFQREQMPTTGQWAKLAYGDQADNVMRQIQKTYSLDARLHEGDFPIRTQHGERRVWSFSSGPLGKLPDGRRLVISTGTDVTDRHLAEAEVQALNTELERRVHERTIQLSAANKELESFSYAVSHDLRAPLRAMGSFSKILEEHMGSSLDERGRHYLHRIQHNADKMSGLIDDLLNLSRLSRQALRRDALDISALAKECLDAIQATEPDARCDCRIEEGISAFADKGLTRVLLTNLMQNAWKFSSGQHVRQIEIGTNPHGNIIVYYLRDNGAGFDMKYADLLFLPFQRLHQEHEYPGTGIGLATVYRIVQRHGGRIWAESTPGCGATFYWTLGGTEQ